MDALEDEDVISEFPDDIWLCVFIQSKTIGIAMYNERDSVLSWAEFQGDSDFSCLKAIQNQWKVKQIVTTSKLEQSHATKLKEIFGERINVHYSLSKDFDLESAKRKLLASQLSQVPNNFVTQGSYSKRANELQAHIDWNQKHAVRAIGGLLFFLEKNRSIQQLDRDPSLVIRVLKELNLNLMLQMDDESRKALQIFDSHSHPSAMGISGGKEGLSLYGVMNDAESIVGKRLLKRWFLQPTLDDAVLHWRQDVVALFLRPDLYCLVPEIKAHLKKIKDVPGIVARMEKIQSSVVDWISLFNSLHNIMELQKFLGRSFGLNQDDSMQSVHAESIWIGSTTLTGGWDGTSKKRPLSEISNFQKSRPFSPQEEKLLKAIMSKISPQLGNLIRLLKSIINFEDSKHLGKLVVQSGIDEYLDTLKEKFFSLPDLLTSVAMEEMSKIPVHHAIMLKVEFVPQIGYLVVTPKSEDTISALTPCTDFEFFFNTEEFVYWKNGRMRQLDNELGDIHSAIADLESAIIRDVEAKLLKMKNEIIMASITVAEIDCLVSFATSAAHFNLVRPSIVEEKIINIKNGRHPLQALCVDLFVPNSTTMCDTTHGNNGGVIHAITGANFSGKSCYIKQVALIVFMAHIGSFVPAESAIIGKVDRIFTRINSRESCIVPLSTFMIDLQQISFMLENCTSRSLLIIDEFGKGTSSTDGVSLLGATIRHLLSRGQQCPRTMLATHFFEMFEIPDFLPLDDENLKCFHLSLHEDEEGQKAPEISEEVVQLNSLASDIVYLRTVVPGIAKKSYGYHCAMRAGIPLEIVERAVRVAEHIKGNTPIDSLQSNSMVSKSKVLSSLTELLSNFSLEKKESVSEFVKAASALLTDPDPDGS